MQVNKDPELLHIYPQDSWHDFAWIMGTKRSLELLRDAIDKALVEGKAMAEVFTSDGEGYQCQIVKHSDDWKEWNGVQLPYQDECAKDTKNTRGPWDIEGVNQCK